MIYLVFFEDGQVMGSDDDLEIRSEGRKNCLTFFKTGNIITKERVANLRKSSFVYSFFIF